MRKYFGEEISVKHRIELYTVEDCFGAEMPGIAVVLDEVDEGRQPIEQYAILTVSFGQFIGIKNAAYIDTNNCPFAKELLKEGIAHDTGIKKSSGFCKYPLWVFSADFLKEHGTENYERYSQNFDNYMTENTETELSEDDFVM